MEDIYCEYCKNLLYDKTGITITNEKMNLLKIKLQRIMRKRKIESYYEYFQLLSNEKNTEVIKEFINAFTTNTTEFFREPVHFNYIKNNIRMIMKSMPEISRNSEIRVWCAACSTGQEPVTLAMVLKECLPEGIEIKILATDINDKVLEKAAAGFYSLNEISGIPKYYLKKYFIEEDGGAYVREDILRLVKYRLFNLMEEFTFKHTFNIIFCRNVMIYFDHGIQQRLIDKFSSVLTDGGVLIVGSSESLATKRHSFISQGPSIYRKLPV